MARASEPSKKPHRPATTLEARENQVIAAAVDLAEKQILAGTASSQVLTHYLKLATTREQLEKEKLRQSIELDKAKTQAMSQREEFEEITRAAIEAMTEYRGDIHED